MKAHEEWFWGQYIPHDDSYDEDTFIKTGAGWKAAVEWVIGEILAFPVCGHGSSDDRRGMVKLLQKELNEG